MNFFEHQDQARRNTTLLIVLFVLAIALMILAFYLVAVMIYEMSTSYNSLTAGSGGGLWRPGLLVLVTGGTMLLVALGSLTKLLQLRGGGQVIAQSLGGKKVNIQTQNEDLRRLLNVVEEMAIASGVPVPPVYVMTEEPGINAFAAGFTPNDAVIGVTHGCVQNLTRDELQGVIAHEFSHILNGDMRLNLRMVGVLHGILILYIAGRMMLRGGFELRGRTAATFVSIGAVLTVVGGLGFLSGRLIKSAVSRQREFLADASAVQFTRDNQGIASALRKIGGYSSGSRIKSASAEEASHMFFGTIGRHSVMNLFATHPPLKERIRRLRALPANAEMAMAPAAAGVATVNAETSDPVAGLAGAAGSEAIGSAAAAAGAAGFAGKPPAPAAHAPSRPPSQNSHRFRKSPQAGDRHMRVNPDTVIPGIGTATSDHIAYAKSLLSELPQGIKLALRSPWGAAAVIYGLLLDSENAEVRDRQVAQLKQTETQDVVNLSLRVQAELTRLDPRIRLPLVDLTIPALREQRPQAIARIFKQIQFLVRADGRLSLSEYTLQIVLQRRLHPYLYPNKPTKIVHTHINTVWDDCMAVLSGLARVGHSSPEAIAYGFRSGLFRLPNASRHAIPDTPPNCSLHTIGQSLGRLTASSPKIKQAVVDACAHTVLVDEEVTLREAELLRAIVISLDCPIPPFLEAAS